MDKFKIPNVLPSGSVSLFTPNSSSISKTLEENPLLTAEEKISQASTLLSEFGKRNFTSAIDNIKTPEQINVDTEKLINEKNSIQDQLNIVKSIFKK
jgi:hypothetical protein